MPYTVEAYCLQNTSFDLLSKLLYGPRPRPGDLPVFKHAVFSERYSVFIRLENAVGSVPPPPLSPLFLAG